MQSVKRAAKLLLGISKTGYDPSAPPKTWGEACALADSYDEENLSAFRVARAELHTPDGSALQNSPISLVARLVGKPDVAITDFGGACGPIGRDFLRAYPSATYTVVETESLVRRLGNRPGWPAFTTRIPANCDIFNCGGTLQYLANPLEVLRDGMLSASRFVILERIPFSETEKFFVRRSRLVENGGGPVPEGFKDAPIFFPMRTISEKAVHDLAKKLGFTCLLSSLEWSYLEITAGC